MKYGIDLHRPPLLWTILAWAPSQLYRMYQYLRGWLFAHGWRRIHRLKTPVLSVGNLTVGGTGKTPVTAFLAEYLANKGYRTVIISRGYGGRSVPQREPDAVKVVSDGQRVLLNAAAAGDEPYLLANKVPGAAVLCHPDRLRAGRWAEEHLRPDIILLDDGFQHMRLHRDYNLLLMDGRRPLGNGRVLPAGPLREPAVAIRRADAILLTRCEVSSPPPDLIRRLGLITPDVPVYTSNFRLTTLYAAAQNSDISLSRFKGKPVVAFCGIAHPQQFFRMLTAAGLQLRAVLTFDDHQDYSAAEEQRIVAACNRTGAVAALTTRKDQVKLPAVELPCPLYGVDMALHLHQPDWLTQMESHLHLNGRNGERRGD
ncbi:MAG: tetraacyldisaccharide 4'-kinase [Acidobacteria bacterium]|nr:tetraacyldisaccharide 4'-kinase [Acidobacteriota bacterium]